MCGIAGIFAYHFSAPDINPNELRRLRDHMQSRGPDGWGEWVSENRRVGFGHRRLSIIDLSERGRQPMANYDSSVIVTFNGEIYNYRELRADLEKKGYRFFSDSDTEVLLHLYAAKGEDMIKDLRGMFAFALWDANKQSLLLARDPYGIKPLYYSDDGWTVRVASQVKALASCAGTSKIPEPAGIVGFLLMGSVPEPFTIYQEIRAVPAGSTVRITKTGPEYPRKYFSVSKILSEASADPMELDADELQEYIRKALFDSVKHHFVSDVPVGVFLSSGIDSGTITGLARDAGVEDLQTVTLAFSEYQGSHDDEAPLADEISQLYKTRHSTHFISVTDFNAEMPGILKAMDQPSIDGINTYMMSKAAAATGLKVALSGLGGDELFGGYPSFTDIPKWVKTFALPSRVPLLGKIFRSLGSASATLLPGMKRLSPKFFGLPEYGGSYPGAWLLRRGIFMPWELHSILDRDFVKEGLRRLAPLEHIKAAMDPDPVDPFARVASLEASLYMRNQLLRDADWAGMAHSLEIRTPLVDATLLKNLAPALVAKTFCYGKKLMAQSPSTPLPVSVSRRKKTGFTVPISEWMQKNNDLDSWRTVPLLIKPECHWSRRYAYSLLKTAGCLI